MIVSALKSIRKDMASSNSVRLFNPENPTYCAFEATISMMTLAYTPQLHDHDPKHTLNINNALTQDRLHILRVLQLLGHLGNHTLRQLLLPPILHLAFISHPAVQHGLGFMGEGGLLLELVGLGFEMGGFLFMGRFER